MRKKVFNSTGFFLALTLSVIFFFSDCRFSGAYEREIKQISLTLVENIAQAGKKRVAVVDFVDLQGNVTELGRFLAEEFSVSLAANAKGFEVIDRTHLKSILAEHKLSATGMIDPQTARKLGKIAGADAILTGTITPIGISIRLSVKILDTSSAVVVGASSGDILKTTAIEELLARGVEMSTSQPTKQDPSTPSGPIYKKVGPLTVTLQNITVSKGQVTVALDFFNHHKASLFVGLRRSPHGELDPKLADEKSTIFKYRNGIPYPPYPFEDLKSGEWVILKPQSGNAVLLYFDFETDINKVGSNLTFSLPYTIAGYGVTYNIQSEDYSVSFSTIRAGK